MRSRSKKLSNEWREFERLVARIERAAGPRGVMVESPARVDDFLTGRKREVDAAIRYTIGTVPVLITVECRKRVPKQDVTWIEQLIGKKAAIRAAKTIAVSHSGFSAAAITHAMASGIEVRELAAITEDQIDAWIRPRSITHIIKRSVLTSVDVLLVPADHSAVVPTFAEDVRAQQSADKGHAKIFWHSRSARFLSPLQVWQQAQAIHDFHGNLVEGAPPLETIVRLNVEPGLLTVETLDGPAQVVELLLGLRLWVERIETTLDVVSMHAYLSPGEAPINRAEFSSRFSDVAIHLGLQNQAGSREVFFDLQFRRNPKENL